MTRCLIICFLFFSSLTALCQTQIVEAIYYDNLNNPYKIERKYLNAIDSSVLYLRITNDGIVGIRQKHLFYSDTTIQIDEYCSIKKRKTQAEILSDNIMSIGITQANDTSIFTYYLYNDSIIIDSVYEGKQSILASVKPKETDFVGKCIKNELKFSLDSLTLDETVKSLYVNDELKQREILNSDNNVYNSLFLSAQKNVIITKTIIYQTDSIPKLYRIDSILLNPQQSEVVWKINRLDWQQNFTTGYILRDATLQIFNSDTLYLEIQYLNNPDLLRMLLLDNIVYDDNLYSIELLEFDRGLKLKTSFTDGLNIINEYKMDTQQRVIEQKQFRNAKLFRTVIFKYF